MCEIIQPCTTQCIARTIQKAKISCKTSMFKPSAQDFLTPFATLQGYTTLFNSFTDFSFHFYATLNFFSIMVRLTDVQRGRAIALLMQGQRQQQVANHFGVNVSTIERLVRRLRETGHLPDRPRSGRPRVMSRRRVGWLGGAKVSCILRHRGVQLILAYSWARPAILVAGKGRWGIFLFLLFLHFHSCSFLPCPSL